MAHNYLNTIRLSVFAPAIALQHVYRRPMSDRAYTPANRGLRPAYKPTAGTSPGTRRARSRPRVDRRSMRTDASYERLSRAGRGWPPKYPTVYYPELTRYSGSCIQLASKAWRDRRHMDGRSLTHRDLTPWDGRSRKLADLARLSNKTRDETDSDTALPALWGW